jgi:hypothetical protein
MKRFKQFYFEEAKGTEFNLLDKDLDPEIQIMVTKKFEELAAAQRDNPEHAMLKAARYSAGVWTYLLEHVGDLTHRMAQNPTWFHGGFEWVKEKVDTAYRQLFRSTGWMSYEDEVEMNMKANAEARQMNLDKYNICIQKVIKNNKQPITFF